MNWLYHSSNVYTMQGWLPLYQLTKRIDAADALVAFWPLCSSVGDAYSCHSQREH